MRSILSRSIVLGLAAVEVRCQPSRSGQRATLGALSIFVANQ